MLNFQPHVHYPHFVFLGFTVSLHEMKHKFTRLLHLYGRKKDAHCILEQITRRGVSVKLKLNVYSSWVIRVGDVHRSWDTINTR